MNHSKLYNTVKEFTDPIPSINLISMIEISARDARDAVAAHFPSFKTLTTKIPVDE